MLLHPEIHRHLKNVFGSSAIKDWYNSDGSALSLIPKYLVKGIENTQNVVKQAMFSVSTFHYVQEGTHAIGHLVNPFYNIPHMDLENNPEQMDAARHGLQLSGDYNAMNAFREGVGSGELLYKIPGIGKVLKTISEPLFLYYIPGLKYKTYQHILKRNARRWAKEIEKDPSVLDDVKYLSAHQANAAYGNLNYVDMGRNQTFQNVLRLTILAPDFLEARAGFAGQASKVLLGGKSGAEQFRALAVLAVTLFVTARILNKLLDDDYHNDEPFDVIYHNRRYGLRSVPGDLYNLYERPHQFIAGRLSPVVGKTARWMLTGKD